MDDFKLKLCPFCGSKPIIKAQANNPYYGGLLVTAIISCRRCDYHKKNRIHFSAFEMGRDRNDMTLFNTKHDKEIVDKYKNKCKESLINWWNNRIE